jgi:phenylpropionate dioxygenase-like ring-hydroxylating dioxygenase large terminal subunit
MSSVLRPSLPPVDNETPALRRAWHAVATVEEVADGPHQVWLLGEPWALVRLDGSLRAFVDRCPHRLAPLTVGRLRDGELQCGYHGWTFAADGHCTSMPPIGAADHLPSRADLTPAWGVREAYGFVWLAPEEPLAPLPEFPEWGADGYDCIPTTFMRTPVSAGQLVDNFLDASHFPYVHEATFGDEKAAEVHDDGVEREDWVVRTVFSTWYRNYDDPLVATGEHEAVQPQILTKEGSAGFTVHLRLFMPVTGKTMAILFACSPERNGSTHVFKVVARNDSEGSESMIAKTVVDEDLILVEDLRVLEAYAEMVLHLDLRAEVHTKADRLSVAWRRLLADMVGLAVEQAATEVAEVDVALPEPAARS